MLLTNFVLFQQYSQSIISAPFKAIVNNMLQSLSSFSAALTLQSAASFACDVGLPDCESLALYEFQLWRRNITHMYVNGVVNVVLWQQGI